MLCTDLQVYIQIIVQMVKTHIQNSLESINETNSLPWVHEKQVW